MARFSLALTAALLLLSVAPLHAQLVTNGTLNTDASGWTLGTIGVGCADEAWDGTAGNPPGAIRLNSCGEATGDPAASQTIGGLTPGVTYTISVDVQLFANSSGGGTGKSFGIFLDNEPGNPLLLTEFLDTNWHTVTVKFVATSTSHTIIFAAELDPRTPGGPGIATDVAYFIDNISLVPAAAIVTAQIPAMSEQALLLLGTLLAVGAALTLRKRRVRRP